MPMRPAPGIAHVAYATPQISGLFAFLPKNIMRTLRANTPVTERWIHSRGHAGATA